MSTTGNDRRGAEILAGLAGVRRRIVDAARLADRDPREITLVAVTKTFPAQDAASLLTLGVYDLGESRDQEARAKVLELAALVPGKAVRWHFVGRLQTNKCRSVAGYADAVHSVDRTELVEALASASTRRERKPLRVFLQLSIDGDPSRGGVLASGVDALADQVASRPELILSGIMAVAPRGQSPEEAFTRVAEVSARLRRTHPEATAISAGMSGDFEVAIGHGATHVRVGSALLGRREPNVR